MLFCDETIRGPVTLCRLLRGYLVLKEFKNRQRLDNNKSMYKLTYSCFKDDDDRDYVVQKLKSIQSSPADQAACVQGECTAQVYPSRAQDNEQRTAHNMSQRFDMIKV